MLTREKLTEKILALQLDLQARGIKHVALFGSRARGDEREDSDIDLMIDVDAPRFTILDLVGVEQDLSEHLGLAVQVTMRKSMSKRLEQRTRDDLIELF